MYVSECNHYIIVLNCLNKYINELYILHKQYQTHLLLTLREMLDDVKIKINNKKIY